MSIDRIDPLGSFQDDLVAALADAAGVETEAIARITGPPKREGMGDVAIPCHPIAKRLGEPPPDVAARLAGTARRLGFVEAAETAGPFLNVRWASGRVAAGAIEAVRAAADVPFGLIAGGEGSGKRLVIEFSSPNAARTLGFHHLRGTIVGAALARVYAARGHDVVRLNYLGDFGHNIGQLLYMLETHPEESLTPAELQALYVRANELEAENPELVKLEAGGWLDRLASGDGLARRRWQMIVDSTKTSLDATYTRLGVDFDVTPGESRYVDAALEMADKLAADGIATVDAEHGSIYVPETDALQTIVLVNRRGMSTYEGRDCAAATDRWLEYEFDRMVYLTDVGQAGRFAAFFAALTRDGFEWATRLQHVGFGQMRIGGQKAKTREGRVLSADDILDETIDRARAEIDARGMEVDDPDEVARKVGIGGVIFGQVRMRINADFEFNPDEAVSLKGDTATRVQYTIARINSIMAKADVDFDTALAGGDPMQLTDPLERRVLMAVLGIPGAARRAYEADDPSHVADGVLAIANTWGAYQTAGSRDRPDLRVLSDDDSLRASRLALAAVASAGVRHGLEVLGVPIPDRM